MLGKERANGALREQKLASKWLEPKWLGTDTVVYMIGLLGPNWGSVIKFCH